MTTKINNQNRNHPFGTVSDKLGSGWVCCGPYTYELFGPCEGPITHQNSKHKAHDSTLIDPSEAAQKLTYTLPYPDHVIVEMM